MANEDPAPAAITPLTPAKATAAKPAPAAAPAVASPQADLPNMAELLAENARLKATATAAQDQAAGYKAQFEAIRDRGPLPLDLTTTTTKPTLLFTVAGPPGAVQFDVVDESEAKRLYCCKFQIDPSLFTLKVTCDEQAARNVDITAQYTEAGADTRRMPGVVLPGQVKTNRRAAARTAPQA